MKIKSQLMKIKNNLIENQVLIKKVILYVRISLKKKVIVNKISFEYRQYKNVLKEFKKRLSLLNYLENDHEIILKDVNKLKIKLIYNMSEKQAQILKEYINKNLTKEYIRHSSFRTTQLIIFIFKKSE